MYARPLLQVPVRVDPCGEKVVRGVACRACRSQAGFIKPMKGGLKMWGRNHEAADPRKVDGIVYLDPEISSAKC